MGRRSCSEGAERQGSRGGQTKLVICTAQGAIRRYYLSNTPLACVFLTLLLPCDVFRTASYNYICTQQRLPASECYPGPPLPVPKNTSIIE